ncbi:unnamed protein product [Thlaspi arvense]|uniref:TIR domain-containing protein n=1 Tax=Thlaspi arvense TaxID=13288 RepID=A0AAU9RPN8_THLAR|nr:unnamed protein product [Thlaspi arvense]
MNIYSPIEEHQVFLNYRGEELRYSFVSHLIDAFERRGIDFVVDIYEQRGKDLKNLFVRIQESRIVLAIFSTRYAESSWCMDELVKIKKLADKEKLRVISIFYKVRPRDVRKQTGEFGDNFWTLARASSGDQIKKWKDALERICDKMGLSLGDKSCEAGFVKKIVEEVQKVIAAIRIGEKEDDFGKKRKNNCSCECEIPIFKRCKTRKLLARDVRKQTGEFGEKFWTLAKASSGAQIKKWKEALECISDKMGLSLRDKCSEADFVKEVVKEVKRVIAAIGLEEEEINRMFVSELSSIVGT